jgi:hypothetical protein
VMQHTNESRITVPLYTHNASSLLERNALRADVVSQW